MFDLTTIQLMNDAAHAHYLSGSQSMCVIDTKAIRDAGRNVERVAKMFDEPIVKHLDDMLQKPVTHR